MIKSIDKNKYSQRYQTILRIDRRIYYYIIMKSVTIVFFDKTLIREMN